MPCLPRQYWETLGAPEAPHEQPWPLPVLVQLGKRLAEMLVEVVRMPGSLAAPQGSCSLIPVLYHVYSFRSFRQVGPARGGGLRVPWGPRGRGRVLWKSCWGPTPGPGAGGGPLPAVRPSGRSTPLPVFARLAPRSGS